MRNWVRAILLAACLLVPMYAAVRYFRPEIAGLRNYFVGPPSPHCDVWAAMKAGRALYQTAATTDEHHRSSKVLAVDEGAGLVQVSSPTGPWWVPKGSEWLVHFLLAEQDMHIYSEPRDGQIVLDCGANLGTFSKRAVADNASLVVAIEPSPENLECLRRNLKKEIEARKVIVFEKGVWDSDTVLKLHINNENSGANTFIEERSSGGKTLELPLTTIDKIVSELKLPRVDYIKMDIEGSEQRALMGAKETLSRFKPAMSLCVYHGKDDPVEVPKLVQSVQPAYAIKRECRCTDRAVIPQVFHFF